MTKVKADIIDRINEIDDPIILDEILSLIKNESENSFYTFSATEKSSVLEGIENVKKGEVLSSDSSKQFFNKWFEEKSIGL